jgi:Cof subfamily protein (haloacid dehalogenase superfamily)
MRENLIAHRERTMIKAAFFDLDGTLVSGHGFCTQAVKTALKALQKNGILIFAATGRSPYELAITGMVEGIDFDGIVCLNGQLCYDKDGIVHRQLFDKEDLKRLLAQTQITPFAFMVVEQEEMYLNFADDYVRSALQAIHTPLPEIRDLSDVAQRDILLTMAYLPQKETQEWVIPALKNSQVTRWNQYGVDIVPKGCSKRTGIEKMLKKHNLTWENVIAFGDGENDYEMLRFAKYGVAMGNSDPILLTGEFTITDSADQDGVVSALKQFGLI